MPVLTTTSGLVMPDSDATGIGDGGWYITEMRMAVEYLPKIIRRSKSKTKLRLYVIRNFEIDCRIDKKVEPPTLSITKILNNLAVPLVGGSSVKSFRFPKLSPPPAGASTDKSKNLPNQNYEWKIQQHMWAYDMERGKYITTATVIGAWSEWCYLGTQWIDTYAG